MKHTLPGQLDLPETPKQPAKPMAKPLPEQQPCDVGLFSDDAKQLDLINILGAKP